MLSGAYVMGITSCHGISEFAEPIDLPNHVVATTLRQVSAYIGELPEAEQNSREWIRQAADEVGSIWFARVAICSGTSPVQGSRGLMGLFETTSRDLISSGSTDRMR